MQVQLKVRWGQFFNIVFDPWVLLLGIASVIAGWMAALQKDPTNVAVMTFIAASAAGVLGGVLTKRWAEITEEKVIVARGKTAVRGLKLLLNNISNLGERTQMFLDRCPPSVKGKPNSPSELGFEEIVGRCRVLQEEALSSIENWTDIIPEADIKTQIGVITTLQQDKEQLRGDIGDLNSQLAESADKSNAEKEALQSSIDDKEKQLTETQRRLANSRSTLGASLLPSGRAISTQPIPTQLTLTIPKFSTLFEPRQVCEKCDQGYTQSNYAPYLDGSDLCPACRNYSSITPTLGDPNLDG